MPLTPLDRRSSGRPRFLSGRGSRAAIAVLVLVGGMSSRHASAIPGDGIPELSIAEMTVVEGQGTIEVHVVLDDPAPPGGVTVNFATSNITAVAPADYLPEAGTLTFDAGMTEPNDPIEISIVDDTLEEGSESFNVTLSDPTGGAILPPDPSATVTIFDDEVEARLSIDDVTVIEGRDATFEVSLFPPVSETVTVQYHTVNGTAVAPEDYEHEARLLVFSPGQESKKITIDVRDDGVQEPIETFTVRLTINSPNATITDGTGLATILDDDVTPSLTINDVEVVEGDDGTTPAVFTVTLFPASDERLTVEYHTTNGTAISPKDYANKAGILTFSPGERTKQITIQVRADEEDDAAEAGGEGGDQVETFTVTLTNLSSVDARIVDPIGTGTIIDDDLTSSITIDNVIVNEGDTGTTEADFTVFLFPENDEEVTVEFTTTNRTAVAPEDYKPTSGILTFEPGQRKKTITVLVKGDRLDEGNETFAVELANAEGANLVDAIGTGTIADDELAPSLSVNDVTVVEGNGGDVKAVFEVSLSKRSDLPITFDVATEDDLARSPEDYVGTRGTLSLAPGETRMEVPIPIAGDRLEEPDETFFLRLRSGSVAVADDMGIGIIVDDDSPAAERVALVPTPTGRGYWLAASDGDVFPFGDAPFFGSIGFVDGRGVAHPRLNHPIVGMAATPTARGYWLVAADGGVFAFGNARFLGSMGGTRLNRPIVDLFPTPSGLGYWLVASDGGIFAFGDATFLGSTGDIALNEPILGMAATPSGLGYWMVARDGGVFAFGDARFLGSMGGRPLNRPMVGMAPTPTGRGYWLVASDGGIFAFGDAPFLGSTGAIRLLRPVVGMAPTPSGRGYWLVATDGGVFALGDAGFFGSTGGVRPPLGTPDGAARGPLPASPPGGVRSRA